MIILDHTIVYLVFHNDAIYFITIRWVKKIIINLDKLRFDEKKWLSMKTTSILITHNFTYIFN